MECKWERGSKKGGSHFVGFVVSFPVAFSVAICVIFFCGEDTMKTMETIHRIWIEHDRMLINIACFVRYVFVAEDVRIP